MTLPPPSHRYASLFFIIGVDEADNELLGLEQIHHFVEILDRYFGNVSAAAACIALLARHPL